MVSRIPLAFCLLVAGAHGDALVTAVAPDCAARRAGLRPGDIVLAADGIPISRTLNLKYAAARARDAGQRQLELTILRRGTRQRQRLPLSSWRPWR